MQILETPGPFSPAFGEVCYTLTLDEAERGEEVSIFNSAVTEKIGIKKTTDAPQFTLNVSDYLRSQITIEPFPMQDSGIIEALGRTWRSCIAYRDWAAECLHTAGVAPVAINEPMCKLRQRALGGGEQDEICWVADAGTVFARAIFPVEGGEPLEIHLGQREVGRPAMLALILNSDHLDRLLQQSGRRWADFREFSVEIHAGTEPMARFEYRITPENREAVRMGWWNRYGAIDFHTFEVCRSETVAIERQQIRAGERNLNLHAVSRRTGSAATAATTRAHGRWLAGIAAAPQVWLVDSEAYVPVSVTDSAVTVYDPERLDVEVHFEEVQGVEFQSF